MHRTSITRMLALLLAAILLLSAGCAKTNTPDSNHTNNTNSADNVPTKPEATAELAEPENNDVCVETPYCTMTIPFAFSELVSADHQQKDAIDSYVFSATLDDQKKVPVYTISFSPDGTEIQGDRFGTLEGKNGTVQVTFQATDPDETLDEEALEAFYTAQETINDVFSSIQATTGFTAA